MVTLRPSLEFLDDGTLELKGVATLGHLLSATASHLSRFLKRVHSCPRSGDSYSLCDPNAGRLHGIAELWRQSTLLAQVAHFCTLPQEAFQKAPGVDCQVMHGLHPRLPTRPVADILSQLIFTLPGGGPTWETHISLDTVARIETLSQELNEWAEHIRSNEQAEAHQDTIKQIRLAQVHAVAIEHPHQLLTEIERRMLTDSMAAMVLSTDSNADTQAILDFAVSTAANKGWKTFPMNASGSPTQQLARIRLWCKNRSPSALAHRDTSQTSQSGTDDAGDIKGWTAGQLREAAGKIGPDTFHRICKAAGVRCGPSGVHTYCYSEEEVRTLAAIARKKAAGKRKWLAAAEGWDNLLASVKCHVDRQLATDQLPIS